MPLCLQSSICSTRQALIFSSFPMHLMPPTVCVNSRLLSKSLSHFSTCPHPSSLHTTSAVAAAADESASVSISFWQTGSHLPLRVTSRYPRQLSPRSCSQSRTGSSSNGAQGKKIYIHTWLVSQIRSQLFLLDINEMKILRFGEYTVYNFIYLMKPQT